MFEWLAGVFVIALCQVCWQDGSLFNTDHSPLVDKQFAIICLSSEYFKITGVSFMLLHSWRTEGDTPQLELGFGTDLQFFIATECRIAEHHHWDHPD